VTWWRTWWVKQTVRERRSKATEATEATTATMFEDMVSFRAGNVFNAVGVVVSLVVTL